MKRPLVVTGLFAAALLVACGTTRPAAPLTAQGQELTTPKGVKCKYDADCFGGQGSCHDGECSLMPGQSGARRPLYQPVPKP